MGSRSVVWERIHRYFSDTSHHSGDIMFGLIAVGIAGASGVFGHIKSRHFVGQRLR